MSNLAAHQPEALAGLLFEQPLDFELRFGGACQSYSHMEHRLVLRLSSLEGRLDQHECRAAQNSVDQKEVVESVCMNGWNSPPLRNSRHSNSPDNIAAITAREPNSHLLIPLASELASHPLYYGCITQMVPMWNRSLEHFGTYAAWGRA